MKFKDIKPFVEAGNYEIDVFVDSLEETLKHYGERYGIDLTPRWQRDRVWTEEQQIAYVEFFLRGGKTARVIYFNSPAFGDDERGDLDDTLLCVDGLQRLTAIRRFLNNEIPVFDHYYNQFEDSLGMRRTLRFNINCLKTEKEVMEWYVQFNSGGVVHTKEEIARVQAMIDELN